MRIHHILIFVGGWSSNNGWTSGGGDESSAGDFGGFDAGSYENNNFGSSGWEDK